MLSREAAQSVMSREAVRDRIISLHTATTHVKIFVIQIYVLADNEQKNEFNDRLKNVLDDIPQQDIKLLIADLNAQIRKNGNKQL